ncbi:hypothetical protein [Microbacterium plantarum]|uniref:Polysaccharide biosynthesis protein n=1 Tax=Microbacterium plantarum TaxID=1816425 RepID=A0ABV5EVV5_9MICO
MNARATLIRSFGGLIFARILAAAAQAMLLFMFARQVTPDRFALTMALVGILTFISALSDLGMTPATTRSVAAGESFLHFSRLNSIVAVASILVSGGLICVAFIASDSDYVWLGMLPFAAWLAFERIAEFRFAVDLGEGRTRNAVSNLVVRRCGPTLFVALGFLAPVDPILLLAGGYALSAALSIVASPRRMYSSSSALASSRSAMSGLRASLPFWLNSVAAQSRQLDVALLGLVSVPSVAAVYAPAARLIAPLRLIPSTLAQAALPIITGRRSGSSPLRLTLISTSLSAVLYVGVALMAAPLMRWLFGEEYADSATALQILLCGLLFASSASVLTSYLQGTRHEWLVAWISLLSGGLSLIFLGCGALLGGAVGASVGLSIGYFVQFVGVTLSVWKLRAARRGSQ